MTGQFINILASEQTSLFTHDQAMRAAVEIVNCIQPYCNKVEICGSLRRHKELIRDVDIVAQDIDRFMLITMLGRVCYGLNPTPEKLTFTSGAIPCEIYFARNDQEFEVMKLERTGDREFTKTLAQQAIMKGLVFRFSIDKGYYKIPMFGLYKIGGHFIDKHEVKHYYCNDMVNAVAATERDIIRLIFDRDIEPSERSWYEGGAPNTTNEH